MIVFNLNQTIFNTNFSYHPENNHEIDFGLNSTLYNLEPGLRNPLGDLSLFIEEELEHEKAIEKSAYLSDEFDVGGRLSLSAVLGLPITDLLAPIQKTFIPKANQNQLRI